MIQKLASIFNIPDYVKSAGVDSLSADNPQAVVVGDDLRIDNKAAAWCAGACLKKLAMAGTPVDPDSFQGSQVGKALKVFGIKDTEFIPIQPDTYLVKLASGGYSVDFHIANEEHHKKAVGHLQKIAADVPYSFRQKYAETLLEAPEEMRAWMDEPTEGRLRKIAGTMMISPMKAVGALEDRKVFAERNGGTRTSGGLHKLAEAIRADGMSFKDARDLVAFMDEFDHESGYLTKNASAELPEMSVFVNEEDGLASRADGSTRIGKGYVPNIGFYIPKVAFSMAGWLQDAGFPADMDDGEALRKTASDLPEVFAEEFVKVFGECQKK